MFGEIAPKTFGRGSAEKVAPMCVMILMGFYYVLYPVVKIFMKIIKLVLGENASVKSRAVTKDDIEVMVEMAEEERTIDSKQIDLLTSILEFPSIKVKDIMVPRTSIEAIKKMLVSRRSLPLSEKWPTAVILFIAKIWMKSWAFCMLRIWPS